ncbi:MAG TPA: hypothetical protein VJU86_14815 [Pyrinomonadaceae bacterium]|nr:hypothetical protein [Pyrinomonadaceae bacterium]
MDKSGDKKEGEHAKESAYKAEGNSGFFGKAQLGMSGTILAISTLICGVLLAVSFIYWQKGGYSNAKIGFYWLIPACAVFTVAVLSAYWYNVVKPARVVGGTVQSSAGRPFVFVKHIALEQPLAAGKAPAVVFILANSGSMEAHVRIWDSGSYLHYDPSGKREPRPTYLTTPENTFSLVPTAEATGRIKFPNLNLVPSEIELLSTGKAALYFFARGEYVDELGRAWPFPFCRIYSPDFPGNVVNCPSEFKIEDAQAEPATKNNPASPPLSIAERPYVAVKSIKLSKVDVGQSPIVEILFENAGKTPAHNVSFQYFVVIAHGLIPENPEYPKIKGEIGKVFMQSGGLQEGRIVADWTIETEDMEGIKNKSFRLCVFGFGTYEDGAGTAHKLKFCGFYNPEQPSQLSVCPAHNSST